MSISPSGRDVVLASRKGLLVVDLDNPYELPRSLLYRTAWNVADVQWNVHSHRTHWVASTANQSLLVWNLEMPSSQAVEHVLKGHTRAITDINWSAHHPEILASCSVDAFVHCWDLRDPRKPVNAFSDWKAGATQVKWNRQNEHIIASSHGRFLRIWDDRRGATPLQSIEVAQHSTKIYGVDFNRTRESGVITCALDQSVKFWDYKTNIKEPEQIIRTTTPVWRARHTPMGWGVLTLPQRGDNTLYLWDRRGKGLNPQPPVHEFKGHTDQVKEFLWRAKGDVAVMACCAGCARIHWS
ncbi:WD40-repeat-containing domain protein [Protomyces lactucae-debilis]|uniref:WD40-repeat-containing domain protein n=1 Tax=Protomyces lactucae-debilis TaxID=2754530 RepID=A0A1Y2FSG7_PROLT|nr:WD40-repeat-containing domain protein [Protomyces lactucae-debilis]ORY86950.1 WD40-repeat-containing domain protein [Protomyces lactucae-debilis]